MSALLHFAGLVVTTMFAAGAAAGLNWMLLRGAFWMMRPATAGRVPARRTELGYGTVRVARAYSAGR
jgi:hypothetical protein